MGEKEIRPQPQPGRVSTTPPEPFPTTTEKPGTGTSGTSKGGGSQPSRPQSSGGSGGWSGSDLYEDGYRMGRDQGGEVTLTDPSGRSATWDDSSEQWKTADGKAMPADWSAGHRPTKYRTSSS